eukprot:SAG31_NODE_34609_length_331_cov_0.883621_1_plen_43_part_10
MRMASLLAIRQGWVECDLVMLHAGGFLQRSVLGDWQHCTKPDQ